MQANPYLHFNGNCEEAFKFYAKCLDGKIEAMMPHEGFPGDDKIPPEWRSKIMHARMKVGDTLLMASDAPPDHYHKPQGFSVNLTVKDAAEAERVFHSLAEGGQVIMPIAETFWAVRFGMLNDRFGTPWMVNCEKAR